MCYDKEQFDKNGVLGWFLVGVLVGVLLIKIFGWW
jgi:hypothetical protein